MGKVLSLILGFLGNSWFLSIVGLILFSVLIWMFGDAVAVGGVAPLGSPISRIGTIAGIWILWLIWKLIAVLRARKANDRMVTTLAEDQAAADPNQLAADDERSALRDRFRDAMRALKGARFTSKSGRKYLYQLPWYLVIGPPGGGKTTAIANSGLKFSLQDQFGKDAIGGVGGTRNCDWFFTEDAVLIDTAGRYTTQDSNAPVDTSAWRGFLELLRRYRKRRPVDGIIIGIPVTELLGADAMRREAHAEAVRKRVQEVSETLQLRAPVYVMLLKCDLVAGFNEFFADLRPADLEQVWGVTFPIARSQRPSTAIKIFPQEFEDMVERLNARVITRLEHETDVQRRGAILAFPQQIALLKEPIVSFLNSAFSETRYDQPVLLRGVYLSSATQEGAPIDRLVGALAQTFGLDRPQMAIQSVRGRSYFLTSLFRDVIFRESGLVTATGFFERNRALLLRGFYAGAAVITGLIVIGMVVSYMRNDAYVAEVAKAADEYEERYDRAPPGTGDLTNDLWALTRLSSLPGGWDERNEGSALLSSFGLSQHDKLGSAAIEKYRGGLRTILMPRLMARLEEQLSKSVADAQVSATSDTIGVYETLKTYLMLADPNRRDPERVKLWIATDWETRYPGARFAPLREEFERHLDAQLELQRRPFLRNTELVTAARETILRSPPAQRIYDGIKDDGLRSPEFAWSVAELPAIQQRFFVRRTEQPLSAGIPGFFTPEGYRKLFLPAQEEAVRQAFDETWVLGTPTTAEGDDSVSRLRITQDVSELYFDDYIRAWQTLLDDLDVIAGNDVSSQEEIVRMLGRPNSPLKAILTAITEQTTLTTPATEDASADAAESRLERIERLAGGGADAIAVDDPAGKVDFYFQKLHDAVKQEGAEPPPIDSVLTALPPVEDCLAEASLTLTGPSTSLEDRNQLNLKCKKAARDLDTQARYQPTPLSRWLGSLAAGSLRLVYQSVRTETTNEIQEAWSGPTVNSCQTMIDRRYPVDPSSADDIFISDFARFFGPGGVLDKFFIDFIQPSADTARRPWSWKREAPVGISDSALSVFETASEIREAFFPDGGASPSAIYEVEPIYLDKTLSAQVTFEVGGQEVTFGHGPRVRKRFEWPNPGQPGARVVFMPLDGSSPKTISSDGDWALFRLLRKGNAPLGSGRERFDATFEIDGHRATFRIYAQSAKNAFSSSELRGFRCPENL